MTQRTTDVLVGLYTAIREVDNGLTVGQDALREIPLNDLENLENALHTLADRVSTIWRERNYPSKDYVLPRRATNGV